MPVRSRASSLASTSRSGMGRELPAAAEKPRGAPRGSGAATSSCSVFHCRQAGHWPSHLGEAWPHPAQAYTVRARGAIFDTRDL